MDKRHLRRIHIVQNLFTWSYQPQKEALPYPDQPKTFEVIKNMEKIDAFITSYAEKFTIEKIARTDLAILRLGIYELVIENELPPKVVIDEAVEIAKELGGDKSYGFINAVLGKVLDEKNSTETKLT